MRPWTPLRTIAFVLLFDISSTIYALESKLKSEEAKFSVNLDIKGNNVANRNKRSPPGELDSYDLEEKRARDMIGKRLSDMSDEMNADDDGFIPETPDFGMEKRFREIVGKRPYETEMIEKRQRDLVGKRFSNLDDDQEFENYDKRLRDLVGKRSGYDLPYPYDPVEPQDNMEKRMREFVDKRANRYDFEKRFRDFVGKRLRDFVGKRYYSPRYKYADRMRELIGKRSGNFVPLYPIFESDIPPEEKRFRDFVGKRSRDFVGKRFRDMIGR